MATLLPYSASATIDGHVYEVGDSRHHFTIQSISKPFVYGLALDDHGPAAMARKVGVEPSGDAFNAISLHQDDGRPLNPMINAGAIATTGQIVATTPEERFERILAMFGPHAGRPLGFDSAVYESEARTGHRNRAIGHLLRNYDVGMPAKSGVGGGVLAVLPGQFGIGVFSPRLDKQGNSVRAVRVCTDLSRAWSDRGSSRRWPRRPARGELFRRDDGGNIHARLLHNIAASLAMKLRLANEHLNLLTTRKR